MIRIRLFDKNKHYLELKLDKGKRHIITKKDLKRWEKIEIMEVEDETKT